MQRQVFEYDPPDRFVAGTVGEPGHRTFYLQARAGSRVTSVALEKQQVAALGERVDEILDDLLRLSGGTAAPALAPAGLEDLAPLDTPLQEDFRVGSIGIAWDGGSEQLIIEAYAVVDAAAEGDGDSEGDAGGASGGASQEAAEDPEDEATADTGGDLLRVHLSTAAARAFAKRALAVVGAGRPPCPFCGLPLDATGHLCPRQNGYRRR
jgi:uncharacterized repeat protein (TIGR03847 family)